MKKEEVDYEEHPGKIAERNVTKALKTILFILDKWMYLMHPKK